MATHFEVTVTTDACVTRLPFSTAKQAAYAALLACRASCDNPAAYGMTAFLLTSAVSRCAWSNAERTVHVEVEKVIR